MADAGALRDQISRTFAVVQRFHRLVQCAGEARGSDQREENLAGRSHSALDVHRDHARGLVELCRGSSIIDRAGVHNLDGHPSERATTESVAGDEQVIVRSGQAELRGRRHAEHAAAGGEFQSCDGATSHGAQASGVEFPGVSGRAPVDEPVHRRNDGRRRAHTGVERDGERVASEGGGGLVRCQAAVLDEHQALAVPRGAGLPRRDD